MAHFNIKDVRIEVVRKNIKNLHLTVHPPMGRVRIAAPAQMDMETVRVYALSKLGWIRQQKARFKSQPREAPREFSSRESHYLSGKRYLLSIVETKANRQQVRLEDGRIVLYVRPKHTKTTRKRLLEAYYRDSLKAEIVASIAKWESRLGVRVKAFGIKKMKTLWGSCTPAAKRIWLNLELAKKPPICAEYVVLHEMAHLQEKRHNAKFVQILDKHMPLWREYRDELNRLPIGHGEWRC